jgi:RNA polymerase sigma-70 factor (ECF subfamily)
MPTEKSGQDILYDRAIDDYGPAIARLARFYEVDSEKRQDLLQEIHLALWRSFQGFDSRCSLRTRVYRVAHSAAISYVAHCRRLYSRALQNLDALEDIPDKINIESVVDQNEKIQRLLALIQHLFPLDRQIILLYLEGMDAMSIGEIIGISPGNVAVKIHRIKSIIADRFWKGYRHER